MGRLVLELGGVDLAEVFGDRFTEKAKVLQLIPGTAFDLRTGWDLSTDNGRNECWKQLHLELPELVIGSPPCRAFSTLMAL